MHIQVMQQSLLVELALAEREFKNAGVFLVGLPEMRSPKTTAKLIHNNVYCFFITIFRLAIPAFFRFTDVTELM